MSSSMARGSARPCAASSSRATALLPGGHAALAAQAGVGEGVGEVTVGADVQVQVERVVLAEGEALEAVDDQRLAEPGERLACRSSASRSRQWRPSRAAWRIRRAVGAAGLAGDLAVAGAGEDAMEQRLQQLGALQVVGGGEGLRAEGGAAVTTAVARDDPRFTLARVSAVADPAPAGGAAVVGAIGSRTMRGHESIVRASTCRSTPCMPRATNILRSTTYGVRKVGRPSMREGIAAPVVRSMRWPGLSSACSRPG